MIWNLFFQRLNQPFGIITNYIKYPQAETPSGISADWQIIHNMLPARGLTFEFDGFVEEESTAMRLTFMTGFQLTYLTIGYPELFF